MFKEVVQKDIAQLKKHLEEHKEHKGKFSGNSDEKEIQYVMNHLENIKVKCGNDDDKHKHQRQEPPQFDLKCNSFVQIRKYLVNWLNFLANLKAFEKGNYFWGL